MSLYRGTTPTYTITFPNDIDMTLATNIVVSLGNSSKNTLIEKKGNDLAVDVHTVSFDLSQEESLRFRQKFFIGQVNWLYSDGLKTRRACSNFFKVPVEDNMKDEVM